MFLPRGLSPDSQPFAQQAHFTAGNTSSLWAHIFASSSGETTDSWSSFIGIATAIIGNILISFALNIQRYAHIRIAKKQQEEDELRRKTDSRGGSAVGSARPSMSYGTEATIAEERATINMEAPATARPRLQNGNQSSETGPSVRFAENPQESQPLFSSLNDQRETEDDDTATDGSHVTDRTLKPNERLPPKARSESYLKSPYWWAGITMMTVGEAGNFLAYGFAPASIVSPLGVVALVSNCMIAPLLLKEPFRKRDVLGVIIAIAGAVVVVMSANDNNPKLGPGRIWHLIATWEFETYLGITLVLIVVLICLSPKYGKKSIFIDLGVMALAGAYTVLSTKGVASLLSYKVFRILTFPVTYLLVIVLIGTAVVQIRYVNLALQRFNSTQVIPVQFVLFTISVIIGSAVLYRDFERTSGKDAAKFFGGCLLTFGGVWLITSQRSHKHEETGTAFDGHYQPIRLVDEETTPQHEPYVDSPVASPTRPSHLPHRPSDASSPQGALVANPWVSTPSIPGSPTSQTSPTRPSLNTTQLPATSSAPILPSEAQTLVPDPNDARSPPPADSPVTPRRPASFSVDLGRPNSPGVPLTTPTGSARQSRDLDRESGDRPPTLIPGVGLMPSPFTTPMSGGSLSAVVADSLRRGFRGKTRLRAGSGGARLSEIFTDDLRPRTSVEAVDEPSEESQGTAGRKRSLSASLGEWFRRSSEAVDRTSQGNETADSASGSGQTGSQ